MHTSPMSWLHPLAPVFLWHHLHDQSAADRPELCKLLTRTWVSREIYSRTGSC